MNKLILTFFLLFSLYPGLAQQTSDCDAAVAQFQAYYNHQQFDSAYDLFSDHLKSTLPRDKTVEMFKSLYTRARDLKSNTMEREENGFTFYKSEFKSATFTLMVQLDKGKRLDKFLLAPYKTDTVKSNFNIVSAASTLYGTIYGTLTLPPGDGPVPVVLIIAGSGPTDRNGNNTITGKTEAYRMIADSLQKAGIACVRYDKRGIGESMAALKDEATMNFDDIVGDADSFVKKMKADKRFSKIFILGHSEGSLIGMIVAAREHVDGFISVSGAGDPADKVIEKQYLSQSLEIAQKVREKFDSLKQGYTVKEVPSYMLGIMHESVQPYIRSWIKYNPQSEIKKVSSRVLILQGDNDVQVGVDQAKLLSTACMQAKLQLIHSMNHVLKFAPEDRMENVATYSNPKLPLCSGFMDAVVRFVTAN